ncbi:uncharacterized protein LOC117111827 [Anneissia japonica]|uniref:uncharacterized protein LOC117111827 n=1 Tax=Anneissia japonica TaxID=1529436 RepID=UPI0014258A90|nr:uncharacterized protein LOC117111827 [Anneissia japonica]
MMEGERLLKCMKSGGDFTSLNGEIKAYLSPLHNQKKCSKENANKYGLFSLKLLHVCVQCWTDCEPNNGVLTNLVMICKEAYNSVVVAKAMMKTSPLALEKLLFHILLQILKKGMVIDGMSFAEGLYWQMQECRHEHLPEYTVDNDYDTVAKQSYNQLWKTCVELEQSQAKQNSVKHPLVLEIRQLALAFLSLSTVPMSDVVERTLKTATEFERNMGQMDQRQKWISLVKFFSESIQTISANTYFPKEPELLQKQFSSLHGLGIQTIKCCLFLNDTTKANQTLELIRIELNKAKVLDDYNLDVFHSILDLLRCLIIFSGVVADSKHHVAKHSQTAKDVDKLKDLLQNVCNTISKALEKNILNAHLMQCLVETLEMVRRQMIGIVFNDSKGSLKLYKDDLADVFVNVLITNTNLLECQRQSMCEGGADGNAGKQKQAKQQLQKNINRELRVLDLLANVLVFQLDDTRSACSDDNPVWQVEVVDKVGMALQKNADLIEQVSTGGGGSLQTNEYRWLGCNAFNLGLLFYRREWYKDAIKPLSLACDQLWIWCTNGQSVNTDSVQEIQLLTKFELLADCQRKAGFLKKAMSSLETSMALMCTAESLLKSSVEKWIKCKRDGVKNGQDHLQTRTVKDAVIEKEIDGVIDDQVTALLHIELSIYKAQRYNTVVEQYAVVCDLLEIYNCEQYALKRSTMLIYLAQLLRLGDFDTGFSPEDCSREAITFLEQLLNLSTIKEDLDVKSQSAELIQLSFAYFWLCVCEMESSIAQVQESFKQKEVITDKSKGNPQIDETSHENEEEKQSYSSSLVPPTSNLGLESSLMEPLNKALDIWRQLVNFGTLSSDSNQELYQCMQMAAAIYHLADRPLQQVVTLLLASTISTGKDYSQSLSQVASILSKLGDGRTAMTIAQCIGKISDDPETDHSVALAYHLLAHCQTLFISGKISEAVEKLVKLNEMELMEKRNKQGYMTKAQVVDLLAGLMNLPIDMTEGTCLQDLCPDLPTPLDLHHDALRFRMGIARFVFGDGIYSSDQNCQMDLTNSETEKDDHGICKWSIIASVLESLLSVGRQYMEQGCVREARCYLFEGLTLAQKFMVPRRCAELMLELARVELLAGEISKARSHLERSKAFLSMEENSLMSQQRSDNMAVKAVKKSPSASNMFGFDASDDEDNFIQSRKFSLTTEQMTVGCADMESSPSLKVCQCSLPEYSKHPDNCHCSACMDIILQKLDMELLILKAQVCGHEGDLVEQENVLRSVRQFHSDVNPKSSMEFQSVCMLGERLIQRSCGKHQRICKRKVSESIYQGLNSPLLDLYSEMFSCLVNQERFSLAADYYDRGLELSQTVDFVLSRDLYALCKLHFTNAVCNLHQSAIENGCRPVDILSHCWNVKNSRPKTENNTSDILTNQFEELSICASSASAESPESKPKRQNWVQLVSTDVRPEMVRHSKKSVRTDPTKTLNDVGDLGIFCDIQDALQDENAKINSKIALSTVKKCTATTKKGSVMYSVKKGRGEKSSVVEKIKNDDVFSFVTDDEDCAIDRQKPKTSRKSRLKGKAPKNPKYVIFCDNTEFPSEDSKDTKTKPSRGKRAKSLKKSKESELILEPPANQKEEPVTIRGNASPKTKNDLLYAIFCEDTEEEEEKLTEKRAVRGRKPKAKKEVQDGEEKQPVQRKTRGRQKILSDEGNKEKPKPGGRRKKEQAVETIVANPNDLGKSAKRRGRKPKAETSVEAMRDNNTSSEDEDDVFQLSAISELSFHEEHVQISPLTTDSLVNGSHVFGEVIPSRRHSSTNSDFGFSISGMDTLNLDDEIDDIEVPRFGSESEGDDEHTRCIRKIRIPKNEETQKTQISNQSFLDNEDTINIKKSVTSVQDKLYQAYNLIKHKAPSPIYNQICHLLAMCHGDGEPQQAAFYLNKAMANTLKHQKLLSLGKKHRKLKKELESKDLNNEVGDDHSKLRSELKSLMDAKKIFQPKLKESSVSEISKHLPDGWTVVTMAAISISVDDTKSNLNDVDCLLISRLVNDCKPMVLRIPVHSDSDGNMLSGIVEEFQAIISDNKESAKEVNKKAWWTRRQGLDQRMKNLVADIEDKLLNCWKGVVTGQPKNANTASRLLDAAENLHKRICLKSQLEVSLQACQILLASTSRLSFQQLTSMLSSITGFQRGSDDLLNSLELVRSLSRKLEKELSDATHQPVILILDKHLQQLPWENISTAISHPVCRVPSLDFLACHLQDIRQPSSLLNRGVDVTNTYYVLNPSNDLANTQLTFQNWFEKELCWKGVVACAPNKQEYTSALTDHDLFVYCGHGNGRQFLNSDDIQRIKCRALTLLMGCSSGRLQYNGSLETSGMALNYLLAGCPCVVANLWDVTDRDIDRFLETLLKSWLARSNDSSYITDYIYEARKACKMSALIGFSPVTYGIPVHLK